MITDDNHAIPQAFKQYKQFINWRIVDGSKVPCNAVGEAIDPHNPLNQVGYDVAAASSYAVGFVFTKLDPFFFIDLDGVFNQAANAWDQIVHDVLGMFQGSCVEVSHSGTGLHVFGQAATVPEHRTRSKRDAVERLQGEFYTSGRFVALTGLNLTGDAVYDYSAILPGFISRYGLEPDVVSLPDVSSGRMPGCTAPDDDDELLKIMENARGSTGAMFGDACTPWQLFTGDVNALTKAYPVEKPRADGFTYDRSRADAALMRHLAFYTGADKARMQRLFMRSALVRDKNQTAYHMENNLGYAIQNCTRCYDKTRKDPVTPGNTDRTSNYMTTMEQKEHFKDCVYIREDDAILTPSGELLKSSPFNATYGGVEFQMETGGNRPTRKAWEAFTENRAVKFPNVRGTYFDPKDTPREIKKDRINTWVEPDITMQAGDPSRFINHVRKLLPNGDDADILLTWMQSVAQNPGHKTAWAPVLQGVEGNGKTVITSVLRHAVGEEYTHDIRPDNIQDKYNTWMRKSLFAVVEEIKVNGKLEILEVLKPIITNYRTEIRDMRVAGVTGTNYVNLIFLTNHKDAIPTNRNDRRFSILYTAQQTIDDLVKDGLRDNARDRHSSYFVDFYNWLEKGGYEICAHWLRYSTIINPKYDPMQGCKAGPVTTSTTEAYTQSYTALQSEIIEAVNCMCEDSIVVDGVLQTVMKKGLKGFRNGWIDTSYIPELMGKRIHTKTLSSNLKALGYRRIGKSSRMINGTQPILYYNGDDDFSDINFTDRYLNDQN